MDDRVVAGAVPFLVQTHGDAFPGRVVDGLVNLVAGNAAQNGAARRRREFGVAAPEHGAGQPARHGADSGAGVGVIGLDLDVFHAGDRAGIGLLGSADFVQVIGVRGTEVGTGSESGGIGGDVDAGKRC